MIHAYIANASLCNIPFLFMCFLCYPYIFTIFVENFYFSLVKRICLVCLPSYSTKKIMFIMIFNASYGPVIILILYFPVFAYMYIDIHAEN